ELFSCLSTEFAAAEGGRLRHGLCLGQPGQSWLCPASALLHCIDESSEALAAARRFRATATPTLCMRRRIRSASRQPGLRLFARILDTQAAMNACVRLLKPRAPFLIYL